MDMEKKTILVTGASSGIGKETAIQLAKLNAQLILVARKEEKLNETLNTLSPNNHLIAPFDLTQTSRISSWLKEIVETTGPLNGLVHCAGLHMIKPLKLMQPIDYQTIFETNFYSAYNLCKAFVQKGIATRPSSIVLLSSIAGIQGQPGVTAYSASKGALIAFTKSMAMEFAAEKIRVNSISPGIIQTPMTDKLFSKMTEQQITAIKAMHPLGLGTVEDVAHAITFLLSDNSRWITGTNLIVDGGYSMH